MASQELRDRLARSAAWVLAEKGYVVSIDVLVEMGWLAPIRVQ